MRKILCIRIAAFFFISLRIIKKKRHSGVSYVEELKPLNIHTQMQKSYSAPISARNNMGKATSLTSASDLLSTQCLNKTRKHSLSSAGTARRNLFNKML